MTDPRILQAKRLQLQIDSTLHALHDIVDALLGPVCREAMERGDETELSALLLDLPDGYHRSKLRAFLYQLKEKT